MPVIWAMVIGQPSAGRSPGLDAALSPPRGIEKTDRRVAEAEHHEWEDKRDVAKLAQSAWNKQVKAAIAEGDVPPGRSASMDLPPAPNMPRYIVNDTPIEKLGVILAAQPRGTLQVRDELAGWLDGMQRYSSGSDRAFWLEAFGGRSYTVERMGREPLTVERLAVSVVGGIQPDRLKTLLFNTDDDGLLARFIPVWPDPVPVKMPDAFGDDAYIRSILSRLFSLDMADGCDGELTPVVVSFTGDAQTMLNDFRIAVREEEREIKGLRLSFLGKLPGLAVRLSLILAALDWADGQTRDLTAIDARHLDRALRLVWDYILPMARRACADASLSVDDRKALRLVEHLRREGSAVFTSREILRAGLQGMAEAADLNPVLAALEDGDVIRPVEGERPPQGGRPSRRFAMNPAVLSKGVQENRGQHQTPAQDLFPALTHFRKFGYRRTAGVFPRGGRVLRG